MINLDYEDMPSLNEAKFSDSWSGNKRYVEKTWLYKHVYDCFICGQDCEYMPSEDCETHHDIRIPGDYKIELIEQKSGKNSESIYRGRFYFYHGNITNPERGADDLYIEASSKESPQDALDRLKQEIEIVMSFFSSVTTKGEQ